MARVCPLQREEQVGELLCGCRSSGHLAAGHCGHLVIWLPVTVVIWSSCRGHLRLLFCFLCCPSLCRRCVVAVVVSLCRRCVVAVSSLCRRCVVAVSSCRVVSSCRRSCSRCVVAVSSLCRRCVVAVSSCRRSCRAQMSVSDFFLFSEKQTSHSNQPFNIVSR